MSTAFPSPPGIIDFLTGSTNAAVELRQRFVFKIVPMLNPDGP